MEHKTTDTQGIRGEPLCTVVQVVHCTECFALRLSRGWVYLEEGVSFSFFFFFKT